MTFKMAAVIRVKRRLEENPLEAIVLNYKRPKLQEANDSEDAQQTTILQLAGTLQNQEEDVFKLFNKPTKTEVEESYKKHLTNITEKIRKNVLSNSKNNRFKVVNCFRSIADVASGDDVADKELTIVDIEGNPGNTSICSEAAYVYDLYYTNSDNFGDVNVQEFMSVYPLSDKLIYGSARDNGLDKESEDEDSDDSNEENNWRNDYPEESDPESVTEDDMAGAMKRVTIRDDLSSDGEEEGFVYSIDSEAAGFEEDVDLSDVRRYGEMYARFKARHKEPTEANDHNLYYGDIDEDEYYN